MAKSPRHSVTNHRQWEEAKRRFLTAMEDGTITPREHNDILEALDGGIVVGGVLKASDAIRDAMSRATDPEYIGELTATYMAYVAVMPESPKAA